MEPSTISRPLQRRRHRDGGQPRRWTRAEYYRMAELGLIRPDERLELLDGEILQKMTQLPPHATALLRGSQALGAAFSPGHHVRPQLPLILNDESEPEPDLLVVPGTPDDYLAGHPRPTDVRLLVEIADTTLRLDQGSKRAAYARAGIPEYWIVNLPAQRLEVYRQPTGERYLQVTHHQRGDGVTPLFAPQATVHVADLLPHRPDED